MPRNEICGFNTLRTVSLLRKVRKCIFTPKAVAATTTIFGRNSETYSDCRELIGSPMCAPSSNKKHRFAGDLNQCLSSQVFQADERRR
jgi:hypothetical protein